MNGFIQARRIGFAAMLAVILGSGLAAQAWAQVEIQVPAAGRPAQWVGLACEPAVDETLRSQLQLPEGVGLVVHDVVPDSPAAKAGIQRHDVLLKAGDSAVRSLGDLVRVVGEGKEFSLELLRAGARQTVQLTPAARPADARGEKPGEPGEAFRWFHRQFPGEKLPPEFRLLLPDRLRGALPFPEGYSLTIEKQGQAPAEVTVKKGEQTWKATEGKLENLPDEVRPYVERALSGGPALGLLKEFELPRPAPGDVVRPRVLRPRGEAPPDLERQLEEMRSQLRELQETLKKLAPPAKE